jgi:predicted metal-dependent hydrolase
MESCIFLWAAQEGRNTMNKDTTPKEALRHGIELFNRAEFFEAHEALEDVWRECSAGAARRRHLQGLVQLAVAFHHESRGNVVGARSVLERGVRNLAGADESLPELDLERLRGALADWRGHLAGDGSRPALPRIVQRARVKRRSPAKIREK